MQYHKMKINSKISGYVCLRLAKKNTPVLKERNNIADSSSSGPLLGWNAARRAHRPKWAKLLHRVTASKYIVPVNISSLFWQFVLQTLQRLFHDCPWQFVLLIPQAL